MIQWDPRCARGPHDNALGWVLQGREFYLLSLSIGPILPQATITSQQRTIPTSEPSYLCPPSCCLQSRWDARKSNPSSRWLKMTDAAAWYGTISQRAQHRGQYASSGTAASCTPSPDPCPSLSPVTAQSPSSPYPETLRSWTAGLPLLCPARHTVGTQTLANERPRCSPPSLQRASAAPEACQGPLT